MHSKLKLLLDIMEQKYIKFNLLQYIHDSIVIIIILCLLATLATGTSSTIHVDRDNNFVNLTCTNDLNVGPVNATFFYTDSNSGLKSLGPPAKYHSFILNKTNEGRYLCGTTVNNEVISTAKNLIRKYHD